MNYSTEGQPTMAAENMDDFYAMVNKEKESREERATKPKYVPYDVKNYLSTTIDKDNKEEVRDGKTLTCRILNVFDPDDKVYGQKPFRKMYGHVIKMKDGKHRTFTCIKETEGVDDIPRESPLWRDDKTKGECPICIMHELLLKKVKNIKDKEENKKAYKEAMSYAPKAMWMCRVIDRSDEGFGPKLWRFSDSHTGQGPFDKLKTLWQKRKEKYNIYDKNKGKDIDVSIAAEPGSYNTVKSKITQIIDSDELTPIAKSEEQLNEWLNDHKKWYLLFPPKPFEFLEVAVHGHTPMIMPGTDGIWVSRNKYEAIKAAEGIPVYDPETCEVVDGRGAVAEAQEAFDKEVEEMNFDTRGEDLGAPALNDSDSASEEIPF